MRKLKQHIALPLLGIFIFPLVFQALHIVWHHAHGYGKPHDVCHRFAPVKTAQNTPEIEVKTEEVCSLCEYQISVKTIPHAPVFRSIAPVVEHFAERLEPQHQISRFYTPKSPRAPPFLRV